MSWHLIPLFRSKLGRELASLVFGAVCWEHSERSFNCDCPLFALQIESVRSPFGVWPQVCRYRTTESCFCYLFAILPFHPLALCAPLSLRAPVCACARPSFRAPNDVPRQRQREQLERHHHHRHRRERARKRQASAAAPAGAIAAASRSAKTARVHKMRTQSNWQARARKRKCESARERERWRECSSATHKFLCIFLFFLRRSASQRVVKWLRPLSRWSQRYALARREQKRCVWRAQHRQTPKRRKQSRSQAYPFSVHKYRTEMLDAMKWKGTSGAERERASAILSSLERDL